MVKNEKQEEIWVFSNWLRVTSHDDNEDIYHEVRHVEEIRTMFATKLEKYGEKLKKEALHEGIKKGKQEGKQEGLHEKAVQTARALLKEGMPVNKIAKITGLSVKEIKKL